MPLYRATIAGHKPVLISGATAAKALASFVSLEAMKSEQIIAAMEAGETPFKAGDKLVSDTPTDKNDGPADPKDKNPGAPAGEGDAAKA